MVGEYNIISIKGIMLVAFGGAFGAIFRFTINMISIRFLPSFPIGVLIVNVLGSFLAGVIFAYSSTISYELKLLLLIGFLGAFTTFSAFSLDSMILLQSERYIAFIINFSLNFTLSIIAVMLGYYIFR